MNIIEEILQNPSNMSYGDDTNLAFLCTFSENQSSKPKLREIVAKIATMMVGAIANIAKTDVILI